MMKHLRKSDKTVKKPRFEYGCFREDEWIFQLKAADGSLLLQSDPYTSEEDCLVAIEHIKMNSCLAHIVRVQSLEQY
ncbi:MAG: YegP family protein [Candidatus Thermoplasmatota archaeon]